MGWHCSTGSTTHTLWRHKRETLNISRTIQTWQLQEDHWEKDPDATEVQDFLQEHTNCQVYLTPLGQTLPLSQPVEGEQCCVWVAWWTDRRIMQKSLLKTSLEHRTGKSDFHILHMQFLREKLIHAAWLDIHDALETPGNLCICLNNSLSHW